MGDWPIILADRTLSDGRHVVLGDIDGPHHLWLRDTPPRPAARLCDRARPGDRGAPPCRLAA
ncbi:DUF7012 domain-containing protein, partial [Sphingomonas sp. Ant H11]|uniref:DUF7012 domain-containing protein n=1 Tax=Sphingomonas sp. Ant H11 TaxID=1564113 RepID=UPI003FA6B005